MGKALAARGDVAQTIEKVNQGRMILEALSAAVAANSELRIALADAYLASGDVQAKLPASRKSVAPWRAARSWYGQSLAIYNDLRSRNLLQASSADKLDELARKIAECDTALAGRGD
jgi:hypothetical protein